MKIKPEHLAIIRMQINAVLNKYPGIAAEYEAGEFSDADKVKDLQKRFCFDLWYGAGMVKWTCDVIYPYANDDHLYTALKAVCPTIERKY